MAVSNKPGFSIVEILIVVMLIGAIVSMVGPNIMKRLGRGRKGNTKIALNNIKSALDEYKMDMGHYPNKQEGNLEALMTRPSSKGSERWKGPYLSGKDVPLDAWNNEFVYNNPPQRFKEFKMYELYSLGENEEDENDADLRVGQ